MGAFFAGTIVASFKPHMLCNACNPLCDCAVQRHIACFIPKNLFLCIRTVINPVHGIYVSDRLLIIFYVRLCKNTWYYCNNKFRIPSPQGWGVFKVLVFSDLLRSVSQYLLRYCVTCSRMCMIVQVLKNLMLHYNLKEVAMLAQTALTCVASASNNSSVQAWWWQSLAKC